MKEMIASSSWMRKVGADDDEQQFLVEIVVMNIVEIMLEVEKLQRGGYVARSGNG